MAPGAVALDQRIGAFECDEGDGDRAVLGRAAASQHVRAHGGRQAAGEHLVGQRSGAGSAAPCPCRRARAATAARSLGVAEARARQQRGGVRADQDLAGFGARAPSSTTRLHAGPATTSSRCVVADAEEVEVPECTPCDMRSVVFAPGTSIRPTSRKRAPHEHGRAAARDGVPAVLEPEQQRIAAELEEARAVFVGDEQNRLETVADGIGDLLRAFAALAREPLGQAW